jgi:O-antigen/teichoic acid export membrane protein
MGGSQRVARNVITTLITQLFTWLLTFIVTIYVPRYLGAAGYGEINFAAAFAKVAFVFVPLGTATVLVKEIARDRSRTGELLVGAILLRVVLGVVMIAALAALVATLHYPSLTRTLVLVYACGLLIGAVDESVASALQGQEKLSRQNVAVLVNKTVFSVMMIALVLHKAELWMLATTVAATNAVSLCVNLTAFRSLFKTLRWPSRESLRDLAIRGLPFMGWSVFLTLYGQTDPIILGWMFDKPTVGWYSGAFRLIGTTLFLPTAVTVALLPTLSRLHHENEASFRDLARRMLNLVMLCSVPIALVCIVMPDRLFALIHYPASFHNSILVLRIGGFGVLLWFAANVLGTIVVASDGQNKMLRLAMMATAIGIPACIGCSYAGNIYLGNGAAGAMFSDVVLELIMVCSYLSILPRGMFNRNNLLLVVKSTIAAVPMAFIMWGLSAYWGFWAAFPSIAVYAALCLLLGCISKDDIAVAMMAFKRKVERPQDPTAPKRETEDVVDEKTEVGAGR